MKVKIPRCHYCKIKGTGVTKDHIVPRAKGGPNRDWNYVRACEKCNHKKADKWPTCECRWCARARRMFRQFKESYGIEPAALDGPVDSCSGLSGVVDEYATIVP